MSLDQSEELLAPVVHWPEDAPAVAVDIDLGKKYDSVEVDPAILRNLLVELGAPSDSTVTATLHINDKIRHGVSGRYSPVDREIHIKDTNFKKILIHEGQHFADDMSIGLEPWKKFRRRTRLAALAGFLALTATNVVAVKNGMDIPILSSAASIFSGTSLGKHLGYRLSPGERKAYKIMRDEALLKKYGDIITLQRKARWPLSHTRK